MSYGARYNSNTNVAVANTGQIPTGVAFPRNHTTLVTAIIVTRRRSPYLAATLRAVQSQTRRPDQILVIDADAPFGAAPQLGLNLAGAHFVAAGKVKSFGAAVNVGLRATGGNALGGWLWLLHDDGAPEPQALEHLLRATEHSTAIGIAGCKQRRWEVGPSGQPQQPGHPAAQLLSVGHTISGRGQRLTGIEAGEIDQGQHDGRQDVLAVSLAGALVKADLWRRLEGTDPLYGHFGDSTDFCRRARRTGARVVVVPKAVVYHAQASLLGLRHQIRIKHSAPGAAQQIAISRGRVAGPGQGAAASALPTLGNNTSPGSATEHNAAVPSIESYPARRFSEEAAHLANLTWLKYPFAWLLLFLKMPFQITAKLIAKQPAEAFSELLLPLRLLRRASAIHQARRRLSRTTTLPRSADKLLMANWREVNRARRDSKLAAQELDLSACPADVVSENEAQQLGQQSRKFLLAAVIMLLVAAGFVFSRWFGDLAAGARITGGALLAAPEPLADIWYRATTFDFAPYPEPPDMFTLVFAILATLAGSGQLAVHLLFIFAIPLAGLASWFGAGAFTRSPQARFAAALVWGLTPSLLFRLSGGYLAAAVAHMVIPLVILALVRAFGPRKSKGDLGALAAAGLLLAVLVASSPVMLLPALVLAVVTAMVAKGRRWYGLVALIPTMAVGASFWFAVATITVDPPRYLMRPRPWGQVWQMLLAQPLTVVPTEMVTRGNWLAWLWLTPAISLVIAALGCLALAGGGVNHRAKLAWLPAMAFSGIALVGFGWWASQTVGAESIGELSVSAPPVPAAGQLLQHPGEAQGETGQRAILYLTGTPSQVQYTFLDHNGSELTSLSVAAQYSANPDLSSPWTDAFVARLISGDHPEWLLGESQELGIGGVMVPPSADGSSLELAAQIDQRAGLTRLTEGNDAATLWRIDLGANNSALPVGNEAGSLAETASGRTGTLGGLGTSLSRWGLIAVYAAIIAAYLLVALPNPRNIWNRRGEVQQPHNPLRLPRAASVMAGLAVGALVAGISHYAPALAAANVTLNAAVAPPLAITSLNPRDTATSNLVCPDRMVPNNGTATNLLGEPNLAGATASWLDDGEQRGLALGACTSPSADIWLVGGTSLPGDTATLRFTNAGVRPATVTLEVFGATGPMAVGSRGVILVAPGATEAVPLDAIAPEQSRLTVHATTRGSVVSASLATTSLAGTSANGVELIDPSPAPSSTLVISALRSDGQAIGDPTAPAVRLLSPAADASAVLTVISPSGVVTIPGLETVSLKAGAPTDVTLGGIEAGEYSVIVTSDQPIVGAGRWVRATGEAHDVAWIPASAPATQSSAVLPAGMAATLTIVAPATATEPSSGTISGRADQPFVVAPGSLVALAVPFDINPTLLTVTADAPVAWGLAVTAAHDPGLVSGLAPTPLTPATSGTITVQKTYVR